MTTVSDMLYHLGGAPVAGAFTTGSVFFVSSTASNASDADGAGKKPSLPFATLDYAVGSCTADKGDIIYLLPGHAESLAADSAVDIDVAGVTAIGIGQGRNKPTFTATATAGDFKMAAAGTTIANIRLLGGIDATTGILEISGADCAVYNSEYRDVTGQATDVILTVDGSDRLLIDGFKCFGAAAAGGNSAIAVDGSDDIEVKNFYLHGNFAVGAIDFRTTLSARVRVHTGTIWNTNAADMAVVDTITSSTGCIGPDIQIMLTDNAANITEAITGATFQVFPPIYVANLVNEQALAINWTAATDA